MTERTPAAQIALFIAEISFNFVLPWAIYVSTKAHIGEVHAIMASSVPPMAWSIGGFIRSRRVDALSILVLAGIGLSLIAYAIGGSPKLLLIRETFITATIGLLFLGSILINKPLIYEFGKALAARQSSEDHAKFVAMKDGPMFKDGMKVMTLVWGLGLLAEAGLRITLIMSLPVATYLIVGHVVGYGTFGALMLWNFLYVRALKVKHNIA